MSDTEIAQMAAFKGLSEQYFIDEFLRLRKDRRGLALKEKPDGSCIFLEGKACQIQAVKPQQCKEFPNRWMNSLWGKGAGAGTEPVLADEAGDDLPSTAWRTPAVISTAVTSMTMAMKAIQARVPPPPRRC